MLADDEVLLAQIKEQIEIGVKYQGYIERQAGEIERNEAHENTRLPENLDYSEVRGLSFEARQKLTQFRPETIGQGVAHFRHHAGCDLAADGSPEARPRSARAENPLTLAPTTRRWLNDGAYRHDGARGARRSAGRGPTRTGHRAERGTKGKLLDYVALLAKWNAVYNLTAIRDPRQMLIQHILDSLSIVPHLATLGPATVLDVGSGGGLPGIVLAIVFPEWSITVNDIVQKKSAFQSQAKAELGLGNLSVVTGRVENLRPRGRGSRKVRCNCLARIRRACGFRYTGPSPRRGRRRDLGNEGRSTGWEIERLPEGAHVKQVIRLKVPALDAERHLIEVTVG